MSIAHISKHSFTMFWTLNKAKGTASQVFGLSKESRPRRENMTSNYHSSHCENDVRYPYTDRVAVGEDYVDFIYQFVKDSNISTKDCKNTASISNIRNNIIGTPSNFPSHELLVCVFSVL
ncbi:uncharacterized protein LOC143906442 [Temnothorax americanus]|uniref:uncharacterized protein LOC143906442 n=1 Tax=Temnothorax americanus TaxID=1964332 RepID=UPI0040685B12